MDRAGTRRRRSASAHAAAVAPGREDVVDQEHARRDTCRPIARSKAPRIAVRRSAPRPPRLRSGRDRAPSGRADGQVAACAPTVDREHPRLVVAALGEPAARERHPRDHVGRAARSDRHHRAGQRGARRPATRRTSAGGSPARAGPVEHGTARGRRRAATAGSRGSVATGAGHGRPHRSHHGGASDDERGATRRAERPRTRAAARTPLREDDVAAPAPRIAATATDRPPTRHAPTGASPRRARAPLDLDRERRLRSSARGYAVHAARGRPPRRTPAPSTAMRRRRRPTASDRHGARRRAYATLIESPPHSTCSIRTLPAPCRRRLAHGRPSPVGRVARGQATGNGVARAHDLRHTVDQRRRTPAGTSPASSSVTGNSNGTKRSRLGATSSVTGSRSIGCEPCARPARARARASIRT